MTKSPTVAYVSNRSKGLRVHANRLGMLCILWSSLELDITLLLAELSDFKDATAKNVLLGLADVREKVKATLAIGFNRKPDDVWFSQLSAVLNIIDNEIRPERNRMIHDFWLELPNRGIQRAQLSPRIVNTQSRQKTLELVKLAPVTPKDIAKLCRRIESASIEIIELNALYKRHASIGKPPLLSRLQNP